MRPPAERQDRPAAAECLDRFDQAEGDRQEARIQGFCSILRYVPRNGFAVSDESDVDDEGAARGLEPSGGKCFLRDEFPAHDAVEVRVPTLSLHAPLDFAACDAGGDG